MRETELVSEERGEADKHVDIVEIFNDVLNYDRSINEIRNVFINILKNKSNNITDLNDHECNWMIQNIDAVECILNSKKAVAVIWCLHKRKESYISEMARLCGSYVNPIRHWISKFQKMWLVESRHTTFGRKIVKYYLNNEIYPHIIHTLIDIIKKKYSEEELDLLITPTRRRDKTLIDYQNEALARSRKIKRKNY